ncbi:MAG TPA: hypothetical protein VF929_07510 [Gemmatimonadaceae bacterium]
MRLSRRTSVRLSHGLVALFGILVLCQGCAALRATIAAYDVGPNGIAKHQQRLREALADQDFERALEWAEDDRLLRALNEGASAFYASQYARSVAVLDSAAMLADDRITTSLSAEALALVTNDMARPYVTTRTERLFIAYYAMLACAREDQWEDAAVEARRLSAMLMQFESDRADGERVSHAMMHYIAGAVFERTNELDDARVAYRVARALAPELVDSARAYPEAGEGELLVVVERGFVAHRATEAVNVFVGGEQSDRRSARGPRRHEHEGDVDGDEGYWVSVAFPVFRPSRRSWSGLSLFADDQSLDGSRISSLVDDATLADGQRERTALLARATTRAAVKYALTKAVKDRKGEVAGQIVNYGTALLERADIRSWHVLPQEITVLRARLPEGQHHLEVSSGSAARMDAGLVTVRAGELTVTSVRLWRDTPSTELAVRR